MISSFLGSFLSFARICTSTVGVTGQINSFHNFEAIIVHLKVFPWSWNGESLCKQSRSDLTPTAPPHSGHETIVILSHLYKSQADVSIPTPLFFRLGISGSCEPILTSTPFPSSPKLPWLRLRRNPLPLRSTMLSSALISKKSYVHLPSQVVTWRS